MDGRGTGTERDEAREDDVTPASATEAYEQALAQPHVGYVLVLYVAGSAPRSLHAIRCARQLCEEYLAGCHDLEIVDIYQQPALAEQAGILAVPALVKKQPPPEAMFVGDLSDARRLLQSLGLEPRPRGGTR